MTVVVQKFGGTSIGSSERMRSVAGRIRDEVERGSQLAVVVSARGESTDELLGLAAEVARHPERHGRELDRLLATGETQSIALLALALAELGIRARSFSGAEAGIRTSGRFGRARIEALHPERVRAVLDAGEVAVVAGFQGKNEQGDVQTLGRGGSDTTAVALAAALGAQRCDIFTDVEGVYSADPRLVPDAVLLERVSYAEMMEMAWRGAKVMHPRAIELARLYDVPVVVRSSLVDRPGTVIGQTAEGETSEGERMESAGTLSGVVHDLGVARITINGLPDGPATLARVFAALAEAEISCDVIAESQGPSGEIELSFTVGDDDLALAVEVVGHAVRGWTTADGEAPRVIGQRGLAKVSLVGTGMLNRPGYVARLFGALAGIDVDCLMVSTSEISVTCVVQRERAELAVRRIHDEFRADFRSPAGMVLAGSSLAGLGG